VPDNYLNNVVTRLRQGLLTTDTILRVKQGDGAKFALPIGDYGYITLRDRLNYEVVKYQIAGVVPVLPLPNPPVSPTDDIVIIRAQDGTTAKQFPVGTCVEITWNKAQFYDTVNQIAELHETTIIGTAPVSAILDDTGVNKVYTISINGTAFQVSVGVIDPVLPPPIGTPPFFVNTATNDAFMWTGTAWLLLTPNLRTGTINPVAPPAIGESPFYLNTTTGLTFGWTAANSWVQLTNPSSIVDLTPYATIAAMNAGDAATALTAQNNLNAAVTTLNAAIAAAGTLQNVTGTAPIASTGGANPNISHNASGVAAGTYDLVTVNATGHATGGTPVVTAASQVGANSLTFSNGLIVKWGSLTLTNTSGVFSQTINSVVVFGTPFPTGMLSVVHGAVSSTSSGNAPAGFPNITPPTVSGFTLQQSLAPSSNGLINWIALGF
jgi:hypothetical protein